MAVLAILLFVIGAALMGLPVYNHSHPGVIALFAVMGVVFWYFAAKVGMYAAFYHRTSANEAFVRTGHGGAKVVLDGGDFIIPLWHRKIPVSLETMKLSVALMGRDHALITKDNLRVNVNAEFYIKVKPDEEGILQAARSLGERSVDEETVEELVKEKLISALRHAAAQMELFEIHARRDEFAQVVQEHVRRDLIPNGIDLESVTISSLDQLDPKELSEVNVFDVQGRRKATEITTGQNVETNRLEREAERAIAEKNVQTRQQILELQKQQAEAEAHQSAEVAKIRAAREREQREFTLEQERAVKEAQIAQDLSVQSRAVEKDQALILVEQQKEQTRIAKDQAVEVTERERQIAVAQKEAERAQAERAALAEQVERERANQDVITVQALATADREAGVKLIAAKQVIEQDKIKRQTDAEVAAFARVKQAEGDSQAAEKQAQSRLTLAEAERKAKELEAIGQQALAMVEVNVTRERVKVKQMEVEVERQALENKQTFERAAIEFEKAKLQIEALKDVQIAIAQAIGQALSHADFKVYGDPNTMGNMIANLGKGLGLGALADGVLLGAPDGAKQMMSQVGNLAATVATAIADKLPDASNGGAKSSSDGPSDAEES